MAKTLVQYIVVRGDLNWPVGALIGNSCHASVAAIVSNLSSSSSTAANTAADADNDTVEYIKQLDSMTKVVLKADSELELRQCCQKLDENNVKYYLWTEQPENIVTCLATIPKPRAVLKPLLSHLKLFK
ncbi:putative peptidyl-tRNA hydrolase PTRHD1 [Oppia nitens]|uniref:putative peptidyl-tRNA hydrolase PTRHD1 n=1 Tax=Oppia nitens TaxID=1686743 RepID=UPI0023DA73BF|nr:putative peptidyl-tRNA hydrolase PTRHD1 [Oppia nitens]